MRATNLLTANRWSVGVALGLTLLLAAAPGRAGDPATAPSGDLNLDGQVNVSDVQCQVVLFKLLKAAEPIQDDQCTDNADCLAGAGAATACRPGFTGFSVCIPNCVHADVNLGQPPAETCPDPQANDGECVGQVAKNNVDLNCDGEVTSSDLVIIVQLLFMWEGGPGSIDHDGDNQLNFCDGDSDNDGAPDADDCEPLNEAVSPLNAEVCDGVDNDCDGLADTLDPDFVADEPCELQAGVCLGALHPAAGCVGGQWLACQPADYAAANAGYQVVEASCDGLDNDCDGAADEPNTFGCTPFHLDVDQDGFGTDEAMCLCEPDPVQAYTAQEAGDCGDGDPEIHPAAQELCDLVDNNCDGLVDQSEDGKVLIESCYAGPEGTVDNGPCEAGIAICSLGEWSACLGQELPETEICDLKDNDCDGMVDEGEDHLPLAKSCYPGPGDTDGIGECVPGESSCIQGEWSSCAGASLPADELCDGKDNNCDGGDDEGCDDDQDGFCDTEMVVLEGAPVCPKGGGDTDDTNPDVNPGAGEQCGNGIDDDSDGLVDEEGAAGCLSHFLDTDGDGAGVDGDTRCLCAPDGQYSATAGGDCNDDDSDVYLDAPETCDDKDNDCDQTVDPPGALGCQHYFQDLDTDTFGGAGPLCLCEPDLDTGYNAADGGDCQDQDPEIKPNAPELCDSVDNNCDGLVDLGGGGISLVQPCYSGPEGTENQGLCHGGLSICAGGAWSLCIGEIVPAPEACDNVDNDCDGPTDEELVEVCYPAGYDASPPFWQMAPCTPGETVCLAGDWGQCDGFVLPQPEVCQDSLDNNCDGEVDESAGCAQDCVDDQCDFGAGDDSDIPFDVDNNSPDCQFNCGYNVSKDEDGNLILDVTVNLLDLPYMWVANDGDKTVSKIDTDTGKEVARYNVGPQCGSPSRTAVQENGAVWVGCREGSRIAFIAGEETDCVDKNGDGTIDSSWVENHADGTKTLHTMPWETDECVLYNGTPKALPGADAEILNNPVPTSCNVRVRAVAVTKDNTVVFGGYEGAGTGCANGHTWEAKYEFDKDLPYQAAVNPRVYLVDHWFFANLEHKDWNGDDCAYGGTAVSYGYAIDKKGDMWVSTLDRDQLYWIDLDKRRSCSWGVDNPYGISIDYAGRIWLGSWTTDYAIAHVFVRETKTMHHIERNTNEDWWWSGTNLGSGQHTRGTAASTDGNHPFGYAAMSNGVGGVIKMEVLDEDPATFKARVAGVLRTSNNGVCGNSLSASGIGLDGQGDLWLVHMDVCGTSVFDGKSHGTAVSIQMDKDKVTGWKHPSSGADVHDIVKSITDTGSHTYTYSDFMGYQYATVVSPTGWYVQRFQGWGAVDPAYSTEWTEVEVALVDPPANPPLYVSFRTGHTEEQTTGAEFAEPEALACVDGVCVHEFPADSLGAYLDVKIILKTDDEGESVTLSGITATGLRSLAVE